MEKSKFLYFCLLFLRFVLTFYPQTGYIHPDEFFQSPEVVYGDVFGLASIRTWEFKVNRPIRSIIFPYITVGIPAVFMNALNIKSFLGTEIFSYLLLVVPRLLMCSLSVVNDICIYKLIKLFGKEPFHALAIFGSCYATLVYSSRTFSNSLETICFSLLIYLTSAKFIKSGLNSKTKQLQNTINDSKYCRLGVLIAIGIFIRPTFIVFAITPIIFLLLCAKDQNCKSIIAHSSVSACTTSICLSLIDTMYYNKNFTDLLNFKDVTLLLENIVITPLNFVIYNLDKEKLSLHGHHPWYLHFLVNTPMMFSVMGIYIIVHVVYVLLVTVRYRNSNASSMEKFMLLSYFVPICLLSAVPHQEPRFLLPLICPLVCLYGENIFVHCKQYKSLLFIWISTNTLALMFFGFFHQGGLIPALTHLHKLSVGSESDFVFFHTYMPPRHLLAIEKSQKAVEVHDLAGATDEVLLTMIQKILSISHPNKKVYLIIPSTLITPIIYMDFVLKPDFEVKLERTFFPHLSLEDPPVLANCWNILKSKASFNYKIKKIKDYFSLNIYVIKPVMST